MNVVGVTKVQINRAASFRRSVSVLGRCIEARAVLYVTISFPETTLQTLLYSILRTSCSSLIPISLIVFTYLWRGRSPLA